MQKQMMCIRRLLLFLCMCDRGAVVAQGMSISKLILGNRIASKMRLQNALGK